MATVNYATNPTAIPNPSSHYNTYYASQRQPSPQSSATTTPTNFSPTSPRSSNFPGNAVASPFKARQLCAPKAPLYVPAVLRPTECPARFARQNAHSSATSVPAKGTVTVSAPITPPSSTGSSFDSKHSLDEALLQRRLLSEDIAQAGISRVVTDEWNIDALEEVTGPPTREHWKPDSFSTACEFPGCAIPFTFLNRRHHCRRCGSIFCGQHTLNKVPLDQYARGHPGGMMERACDTCFSDYHKVQEHRKARANGNHGSGTTTPVPIRTAKGGVGSNGHSPPDSTAESASKRNDSLAESFGKDFTWSTF